MSTMHRRTTVVEMLLLLFFLTLSSPSLQPVHGEVNAQVEIHTSLCYTNTFMSGAHAIAVDDARQMLYVVCSSGILSKSLKTGAIQQLVNGTVGTQCPLAMSLDVNTATGAVFATCLNPNLNVYSIYMIDPPSGSITAVTGMECSDPDPPQVRVNSITGIVWATCLGTILAINVTEATPQIESYPCSAWMGLEIDSRSETVHAICGWTTLISLRHGVITNLSSLPKSSEPFIITVDPWTGVLYVGFGGSSILSYAQGIQSTVLGDFRPWPMAISVSEATGILYTAYNEPGFVLATRAGVQVAFNGPAGCIDPHSLTMSHVEETVYAVCVDPEAIAIHVNTTEFVTNEVIGGSLGKIGSSSFQLSQTLVWESACDSIYDILVDDATSTLYAACFTQGILATSLITGQTRVLASYDQCKGAQAVDLNPSTGVLYAACYRSHSIISIQPAPSYAVSTVASCSWAFDVSVNPSTGLVYAACWGGGGIISIDGGSVQSVLPSSTCIDPSGVDVDPLTGTIYVTCTMAEMVIAVNGGSITTLSTGTECLNPLGVLVNGVTGVVYVACGDSHGVMAFSNGTQTQVFYQSTCNYPFHLALNPATGVVAVTCEWGGGAFAIAGNNVFQLTSCTPNAIGVSEKTGITYVACGRNRYAESSTDTGSLASSVVALTTPTMTTFGTGSCVPSGVSVSSASGVAFVRCQAWRDSLVGVITIDGINSTQILSGLASNSSDLGIGSAGVPYIVDGSSGAVLRLSTSGAASAVGTIPCTAALRTHIAVDDDRGFIYVTCGFRTSVTGRSLPSLFVLVAGATKAVSVADASVVTYAGALAIDPVTGIVYVESAPKGVLALTLSVSGSGASATVSSTVTTAVPISNCSSVWDLTIDSAARTMKLTCASAVASYNLTSSVVTTPSSPCHTASTPTWQMSSASSDGSSYVLCESGSAYVEYQFNFTTPTTAVTSSTTCASGRQVRIDESTGVAYLACASSGLVVVSTQMKCPDGLIFSAFKCVCPAGSLSIPRLVDGWYVGCSPCPAGTYSSAGDSTCTPCASGTYSSSGSATCITCASWYFASSNVTEVGSSTCVDDCAAGYWCAANPSSSSSSQSTCTGSGEFCPLTTSVPSTTPAGMMAVGTSTGNTTAYLSPCPSGSFCNGSGVAVPCAKGFYQSAQGATACRSCAVGSYSPQLGASTCTSCARNFTSSVGASECTEVANPFALTIPSTMGECSSALFTVALIANTSITKSQITSVKWGIASILSPSGEELLPTAAGYNATAAALVQAANIGTLDQLSTVLSNSADAVQMSLSVSAAILWVGCTYAWRVTGAILLPWWNGPMVLDLLSATTVQSIGASARVPTAATIVVPTQMRRSESHTLAFTLMSQACKFQAEVTLDYRWVITDAADPTTMLLECRTADCTLPPLMMTIGRVYVSTLHLGLTRTSTGEWIGLTSQTGFTPVASPIIAGFDAPTCTVDQAQPLILDAATHSYDPDDTTRNGTALAFNWQCRRLEMSSGTGHAIVTAASCALPSVIDFASSLLLIPADSLQPGVQYQFVVTVSTADGRSAAHAAVVTTTREYF